MGLPGAPDIGPGMPGIPPGIGIPPMPGSPPAVGRGRAFAAPGMAPGIPDAFMPGMGIPPAAPMGISPVIGVPPMPGIAPGNPPGIPIPACAASSSLLLCISLLFALPFAFMK